uniref:Uncharacterized protein n=1 Tax=Arundo donax TaxID=35708 RepID=A0A0A9BCR9_ARUDO
MRPVSAAP